jgi:hypothetical protein
VITHPQILLAFKTSQLTIFVVNKCVFLFCRKLSMESKKHTRALPALMTGIKIEPGTLGAAPGRLPSFGGRRDLTLGSCGPSKMNNTTDSKPKRIYTPNLNVQRNKNKV